MCFDCFISCTLRFFFGVQNLIGLLLRVLLNFVVLLFGVCKCGFCYDGYSYALFYFIGVAFVFVWGHYYGLSYNRGRLAFYICGLELLITFVSFIPEIMVGGDG